jgi:hypothetical protein
VMSSPPFFFQTSSPRLLSSTFQSP